ncbi:hypothetical protein QA646_08475 [Rhizobium sp. CB3090]|uniref:hypothetical protein n=1 Tax=Rhizobium sp. CB3090 TaxID=3039156 RepID=UPI0024B282F3|nr:hypothetical protein [Rhizobium sp. CB3090]WFU10859.1 hypothetical protein QA646_08475 [Rhizobium sp. CB3090]
MGTVVQFRLKKTDGRPDCARLEEELTFSLPRTSTPFSARPLPIVDDQSMARKVDHDAKFPSAGIAIIACAIIASVFIAFHLAGQSHYSARANLLPPVFAVN